MNGKLKMRQKILITLRFEQINGIVLKAISSYYVFI